MWCLTFEVKRWTFWGSRMRPIRWSNCCLGFTSCIPCRLNAASHQASSMGRSCFLHCAICRARESRNMACICWQRARPCTCILEAKRIHNCCWMSLANDHLMNCIPAKYIFSLFDDLILVADSDETDCIAIDREWFLATGQYIDRQGQREIVRLPASVPGQRRRWRSGGIADLLVLYGRRSHGRCRKLSTVPGYPSRQSICIIKKNITLYILRFLFTKWITKSWDRTRPARRCLLVQV